MAVCSAAVIIEKACKYYGRPDKPDFKPVLKEMDMVVDRGIIYGLLGPSGCGKTTLLSCIVGRRKLNSGNVWVLGGRPGDKGSGVPGPRVGYMPQDIALVGEFTVRDAIYYFGRIYGMKMEKMVERFEFLSNLLDLPSGNRLIKTLSGGQQRRVSLAAALVHEPELLILDEPTVGLDPVLRERKSKSILVLVRDGSVLLDYVQFKGQTIIEDYMNDITLMTIWDFLAEQARGGTTVIITTHYIDETKQAHKIGLLRDGQLLAEDSPEDLLRKFDCDTLEEAFLKLAMRQHQMPRRRSTLTSSPDVIPDSTVCNGVDSRYHSRDDFPTITSSTDVLTKKEKRPRDSKRLAKSRYKAVFIKSIQQFSRHPGGLIFSILFPIIQVVAFFSAVGHDPRDLHIGVVNEEAALSPYGLNICNNNSLQTVTVLDDDTCDLYMLSCWFLEEMKVKQLYQTPFNTSEEAKHAVSTGKLYGALHFSRNFSNALSKRVTDGEVDDDIVDDSSISVWLDMTNHQISNFMKTQLHKAYESFTRRAMKACGRPDNLVQIPVHFQKPVYGTSEPQVVSFMAPGILITILFFLSAVVTSTLMISDRLEGVWERSAVAGVKPREMLNVHITLQSSIILIQTAEMMALAFVGYGIPSVGSKLVCALLLFLQGICGMCYGFLLSVYCPSHTMSFFVATGSFYPMILLCGILWPLEGMSKALRIVALTLPFTIPSKSLRDIMEKGASITEPSVIYGFLTTLAWIVITLALIYIRLRFKKT